jgi:predicted AAA+ superfamily ATPase
VKDIGDLRAFRTFLTLAAGRTAQEINLSSLGGDAGVSHNTARAWLGLLEASFITTLVPAWHRNVRKQIIKAPKLHFIDTGVACSLLGIRDADQLRAHPLRGALFESWVAGEILKGLLHRGRQPDMKHYRESRGVEIDFVVEQGGTLHLVECKSGATAHPSFFEPLAAMRDLVGAQSSRPEVAPALVYGGAESHPRRTIPLYSWRDIERLARRIAG